MRKLACLASFSLALVALGAACATAADDEGSSSADALTTLTTAQCKTPAVHTSPKTDASGAAIAGSAHTTLAGCIVGAQGETGDAQQQDQAASASVLVTDVFRWLTTELAKSAPPPHPVTPPVSEAGVDSSASDGGSSADAGTSDADGGDAATNDASPE
jgi:hypothetical protein